MSSADVIAAQTPTVRRRVASLKRRYGQIDVDDCVQQTLLEALRSAGANGPPRAPGPWIRRIADRVVWRELASRRCHPHMPVTVEPSSADLPIPDGVSRREEAELVAAAVADLPDAAQRALLGYYGDGKSCVEIAEELGTSHAAVKQRLLRARTVLVSRLEKRLGRGTSSRE